MNIFIFLISQVNKSEIYSRMSCQYCISLDGSYNKARW